MSLPLLIDLHSTHLSERLGFVTGRGVRRSGVAAGAAAVMSAHLLVPALDSDRPATLSPSLLEGLLRQQLGFERVIFSDALDMRAIADGWGDAEAALQAFHAGVDVPIICNVGAGAYQRLLDALERAGRDGSIDPARARRAAAAESGSGASDRAAPVSNLVAALRAARFATVWVEELADLAAQLPGSAALLVASRERRPLTPTAIDTYRRAFALAQAQRIPAVHVALWNPMRCAQLPGPAVVTFGFRPASAAAAVAVLLGGVAEGRAPIPLSPGWGGA